MSQELNIQFIFCATSQFSNSVSYWMCSQYVKNVTFWWKKYTDLFSSIVFFHLVFHSNDLITFSMQSLKTKSKCYETGQIAIFQHSRFLNRKKSFAVPINVLAAFIISSRLHTCRITLCCFVLGDCDTLDEKGKTFRRKTTFWIFPTFYFGFEIEFRILCASNICSTSFISTKSQSFFFVTSGFYVLKSLDGIKWWKIAYSRYTRIACV